MIKKRPLTFTRNFGVYDENNVKKYNVTTGTFKKTVTLSDLKGNEIGKVEKAKEYKYSLIVKGCKIGTISWIPSFKPKFAIDFNGWHIQGKPLKWLFDVHNACDTIVMQIHEPTNRKDAYIIEFANPEDEVIGLLLVLTIDLFMNSN